MLQPNDIGWENRDGKTMLYDVSNGGRRLLCTIDAILHIGDTEQTIIAAVFNASFDSGARFGRTTLQEELRDLLGVYVK